MDVRTVAEDGLQAPAALYTLAGAREVKFTSFSASRNDTRAQFLRWFCAEPAAISAGVSSDLDFESASTANFPPVDGPSFGQRPDAQEPASSVAEAEGTRDRGGHEDNAEILPQWLSAGTEAHRGEPEAGGSNAVMSAAAASRTGTGESSSSRWLLLNEVAPPSPEISSTLETTAGRIHLAPTLLAFSIAGGTGKTTVLATLARALAAIGERILLADTTRFSLAPCYFGATPSAPAPAGGRDSKQEQAGEPSEAGINEESPAALTPASMRTFSPPAGRGDAPVDILLLPATGRRAEDRGAPDSMRQVLLRHVVNADRILVDIQTGSESAVRRLLWLEPLVLVPLLPDMNSVATVAAVERAFAGRLDKKGCAANLVWLLNQYDPALPLHLDVRAALERQLGERLLPFVLRRSPEVSEAMAEGMTVVDYAPHSAAAEDYARLADWLREVAPSSLHGLKRLRWSEA